MKLERARQGPGDPSLTWRRAAQQRQALRPVAAIAFFAVFIAAGAVSLFILQQILAHSAYPFDLDEANHANGALAMLMAYRAGGFTALLRAFAQQGFYPPAFAPVQLLSFALLGPSFTAARVCSVAAFFLAILLIFALCVQIDKKHGWLAGLIACGATLTSAPLLVNAGLVMKEAPGLLVSILFLICYLRSLRRATRSRLLLAGVLLFVLFLTKYTYGVAAVATTLLVEFTLLLWPAPGALPEPQGAASLRPAPAADLTFWQRLRRQARRRSLWLLAPFLLALAIWFALPGNLALFGDYVTAQPEEAYTFTLDNLLFYPRSIFREQSPAPIFALVTALALLWALQRWRDTATRLLLIYFVAGLAMMTLNRPQNPRFIATFVPAAHILSALMLARLSLSSLPRRLPAPLAALAPIALLLALILLSLPTTLERFREYPARMTVAYETDPAIEGLAAWVQSQLPPGQRFYIVNYWDQFGPQTLAWRLGNSALATNQEATFSDVLMPSALLAPATPQRTQQFREQLIASGATYLLVLEGAPWGAPFWPEYTADLHESPGRTLQHAGETTVEIPRPVAPGQWQTLTVKAILYRWSVDS